MAMLKLENKGATALRYLTLSLSSKQVILSSESLHFRALNLGFERQYEISLRWMEMKFFRSATATQASPSVPPLSFRVPPLNEFAPEPP